MVDDASLPTELVEDKILLVELVADVELLIEAYSMDEVSFKLTQKNSKFNRNAKS